MPLPNRVTPYGTRIATPERGLFWGNRGCLHNAQGEFVRYSAVKAWLICLLQFKGRRRRLLAPGRLSELFFLDEATALAAGHRPCGECRHEALAAFKRAWPGRDGGTPPAAPAIDARLHLERLRAPGLRRTHWEQVGELPQGAIFEWRGTPRLRWQEGSLEWTPGGYLPAEPPSPQLKVRVITPRSTVATLARGYRPVVHPSADRWIAGRAPSRLDT